MNPSQEQKDARVELSVTLHGDAAILASSPPGPDTCPASCPWCYHQGVAILPVVAQPTETELAEGVG